MLSGDIVCEYAEEGVPPINAGFWENVAAAAERRSTKTAEDGMNEHGFSFINGLTTDLPSIHKLVDYFPATERYHRKNKHNIIKNSRLQ